jgi:hypothetical protein
VVASRLHLQFPVMLVPLQPPPPRLYTLPATPGTTALSSPPGFEECYETLRHIRASRGRSLLDLRQLEAHAPSIAARLGERVNFDVPTTRFDAVVTFFAHPTARFISAAVALSVAARAMLGPLTAMDAVASIATASFWVLQEPMIHKLLHTGRWYGATVHRWHHELPYFHVSLDGVGLAAVWFSVVAALLVSVGALCSALPTCITALATYALCGGVYEASHYLAHTRVPLPPALRRIRTHHHRHHTLSSQNWLAFTVPAVDSLFGTNPTPREFAVSRGKGMGSRARSQRQSRRGLAEPQRSGRASERVAGRRATGDNRRIERAEVRDQALKLPVA